jgi:hypothetical protein
MKLHLGCGKRFIPGWVHVDQSYFEHVDFVSPVDDLFFVKDNSVSEIYASHVLEYFDLEQTGICLRNWYQKLEKGGTLRIAVPNFPSLIEIYNHPDGGLFRMVGPLFGKWELNIPVQENDRVFSFKPTTRSEIRYHKFAWDFSALSQLLYDVGFGQVEHYDPFAWCEQISQDYDDHSLAVFPPGEQDGILVSLCVLARRNT